MTSGAAIRRPELVPISGCGAKGPACFLVESGDARLLLDLGYGPQPGLWPDVSGVGEVDAVLLSHGHRDHAGALELLPKVGNPPVYATEIVRRQLPPGVDSRSLPLRGDTTICGVRVATGRNGHAPGGVWLHLAVEDGLLYMGDYSVESALYAFDAPPPAATVILDGSYGAYDTSLGDSLPGFAQVFDGGAVLMPVPPAGRGPEIALHLVQNHGCLPRLDSAMRTAMEMLVGSASECLNPAAAYDLKTIASEAESIGEKPAGVMLAGSADGTSGEAARLIERWESDATPQIVFTGYLPPGTPAERLTRSGRGRYMRWNVHPRLRDNAALVRNTGARAVIPAFGERQHLDAWTAQFAPARVHLQGPVAL